MGVASIALGVLEKYDVNVPIVPVGLTYFRGHRFRGRVVVEYGAPIHITPELFKFYQKNKRQGSTTLLKQVEEGMRSVIVAAPEYSELKMLHTIRRLYQRSSTHTTTKAKQDLARRFSVAYRLLRERYGKGSSSNNLTARIPRSDINFPDDLKELQKKIEDYQNVLDHWGLKDYQLMRTNMHISYNKLLYTFVHGAVVLFLASIPSLILNAPVGMAANYWSRKQAQKDLKASRVKLQARDVLLSKKIVFSLMAVPTLWFTYLALLLLFSPLETRTIIVLFLCCPLFSYIGAVAVERGMVDIKDLRPAFLRLLPSFRKEAPRLIELRAEMQREVRAIVKKYGPQMGPLYTAAPGVWEENYLKQLHHQQEQQKQSLEVTDKITSNPDADQEEFAMENLTSNSKND